MAKWIELNNGILVNLDAASSISKNGLVNAITYEFVGDDDSYVVEKFKDEEERDKRYAEIKCMLMGE